MMPRHADERSALQDSDGDVGGKQIYFAFCLGMVFDLASIYFGNPYLVSLLAVLLAALMTFKWLNKPMPWIVLVSVIAANPVNINASISLNLIFAFFLILLNTQYLNKLPSWLYIVLVFAFVSILGSVINWRVNGGYFTQFAAILNYIVGPFFLIPLIYFRLQKVRNAKLLLTGFVISLIVPSVILMYLARLFGSPVVDSRTSAFDYLVNISVYYLGNVEFQLTRTHAGILLASLICASFAVIVSSVSKTIRLLCVGCLIIAIFLLLVTGSVGSTLAALCGIILLLITAQRYNSLKRYIVILPIIIGFAFVGWNQVPQGIKTYADSRYEERFSGSAIEASDRTIRWQESLEYMIQNPEGRGWDLYVSTTGSYPHNEYLAYAIAFGFLCGLLYIFVPAKILFSMLAPKVRIKSPAQITILLAGVGVVTVLLFISFSDHLTANRWYFNVVWSIVWYSYFASMAVINPKSDETALQEPAL